MQARQKLMYSLPSFAGVLLLANFLFKNAIAENKNVRKRKKRQEQETFKTFYRAACNADAV